MKRVCTICARGGSKGVPNKNIRIVAGKPLLAYSILQAQESHLFDAVAVSSDSPAVLEVAAHYGVRYLIERPLFLANDTAPKLPAIRHCVKEVERITKTQFDTIVDLDATSPLRSVFDIQQSVELLEEKEVSNVITAMPARRSPYFNMVEVEAGKVKLAKTVNSPIVRRQDAPACFDMNASIYVWSYQGLFEKDTLFNEDTALYVMPEERSIDIDSELDLQFVEFLLNKGEKKND